MKIFGTIRFSADGYYNGKRIGDLTQEERDTIRRRFLAKGAKKVIFEGEEPYFTKEFEP